MRIVFTASRSLLGKAIRIGSFSRWNHVDVMLDDATVIGSVGKYGVHKLSLDERLHSKEFHTFRYKIDQVAMDDGKALEFLLSQLGKPYDFTGIAAFLWPFRQDWQATDKWFCSELIAAAAAYAGTPLVRMESAWVSPGMLDRSPLLRSFLVEQKV